ncbi:MAG: hypothetical protein M0O99_02700 [Desulfuromonas thiophila]|jgi:hypothetical protein|nr:hypothetical protein [Desulfuromonas thiophila]
MTTDLLIKFKNKEYPVPEGFTVEEYQQSLASIFPEAANAKLIKDSEGVYTLKPVYAEKG